MSILAASGSVRFVGSFDHAVDTSYRVMFPGGWRPVEKDTVFSVLPWPLLKRKYLLVLPPTRWNVLVERLLATFSLVNEKAARIERAIAGEMAMVKLDKVGRICLGEKIAAKAGISRQAKLVGRIDKFEIWDPARLDAEFDDGEPILDEDLEKLML